MEDTFEWDSREVQKVTSEAICMLCAVAGYALAEEYPELSSALMGVFDKLMCALHGDTYRDLMEALETTMKSKGGVN